jgi:hypothetical protein
MTKFPASDFKIIDSHVHFFPEKMFRAIWKYWKEIYLPFFPKWNNIYEWPNDRLVKFLQDERVERYAVLNYAHKKNIAAGLNEWTHAFCMENPSAIPFGAAHPDDDDLLEYSEKAFSEYHFRGIKLQLLVTDFYVYDIRLSPLYKMMRDLDKILILHTGTAPGINRGTFPGAKVGVKYFLKYLNEFPENKVIIAHMGGYEFEDFFRLVEDYPNIYLDTAMIWGPAVVGLFEEEDSPENIVGKERLLSFMEKNNTKILFGSDFPNIPYDYRASIDELLKLDLSKTAFENILYNNAKRLFGI